MQYKRSMDPLHRVRPPAYCSFAFGNILIKILDLVISLKMVQVNVRYGTGNSYPEV